jgi:Fuc2NAc and GlcNAc transferase
MGMVDAPNERSSHSIPTPKGGGLAFFAVFSIILTWYFAFYPDYHKIVEPILYGGPFVVLVGWLDDRFNLSAAIRLLVHFAVAVLIYGLVTQWFRVPFSISFLPDLSWMGPVFSVFFIAWFINLYNFMDGADGLAASNAVVGSVLMAVLASVHASPQIAMVYCLIAYTVSGFLFYNWGSAKIFMGDTGAYFLGFLFAALALISKAYADVSFYSHIIIFGFFIFDATYVLFRRALRWEKLYQAHRMFIFHKLIDRGWSHRNVASLYVMVQVIWLFPLANIASIFDDLGAYVVALAYFPLFLFALYTKAGEP